MSDDGEKFRIKLFDGFMVRPDYFPDANTVRQAIDLFLPVYSRYHDDQIYAHHLDAMFEVVVALLRNHPHEGFRIIPDEGPPTAQFIADAVIGAFVTKDLNIYKILKLKIDANKLDHVLEACPEKALSFYSVFQSDIERAKIEARYPGFYAFLEMTRLVDSDDDNKIAQSIANWHAGLLREAAGAKVSMADVDFHP